MKKGNGLVMTTTTNREGVAWRERAGELAAFFRARFVNRSDCYGGYVAPALRGQPRRDDPTKKIPTSYTAKLPLTDDVLRRHARGAFPEHVVGAHTTSLANTCLWGGFDVDRHSDAVDPRETLGQAQALYHQVGERGFRPLLLHSNGKGGYHLLLLLAEPAPCRDLLALLALIAKEADFRGEHFPKQPAVLPGKYGNWLRLPGRHHTRDSWTEAFDGSDWLSGAACVEWLLSFAGDAPALVPAAPPPPPPAPRRLSRPGRGPMGLLDRVARYVARLPSLGEGEGRNRVAFNLAAFLVRDVSLDDADALTWLSAWDSGNRPPLGKERLAEVLRCAHNYGRHAYGSAVSR